MTPSKTFSALSGVPGFNKVITKISASTDPRQKEDLRNQLLIAQMLNRIPYVKVQQLEHTHDIVFEYWHQTYAAEV